MAKSLIFQSLARRTDDGSAEELEFEPGVNTIVGRKDAGKTSWLKMLDYLLGDSGPPDDAFGKLAEKYASVSADVAIGGAAFRFERRWKEPNVKGKIFVNDDPYTTRDFWVFLLALLEIPILHFPQGNPFCERAWPELSWRTLFRHIYRQERFWSDIADQQPNSEQFAALMQFLGIAEKLFPQDLGNVVSKRKALYTLNAKKEQFQDLIDNIASKMTSNGNSIQFATSEILNERISQLEGQVQESLNERQRVISEAVRPQLDQQVQAPSRDIQLSDERMQLTSTLNTLNEQKDNLTKRLSDMRLLLGSVDDEVERLKRAKLAGSLLDDLKITHCPACDQEVDAKRGTDHECFLCLQPISVQEGNERLDFEMHQMESERSELKELISKLEEEDSAIKNQENHVKERITVIDRRLQPIRSSLGALIDPKISVLDAERGRTEEQIENYKRLLSLLEYRDQLSKNIDDLNAQIAQIRCFS